MECQSLIFKNLFKSRKSIVNWIINFTWLALLVTWSVWPIGGFFLAADWGFSMFGYELGKKRPEWIERMPDDVYSILWVVYWITSNALFLLFISSLPRLKQKLGIGNSESDDKKFLSDWKVSESESGERCLN